MTGGSYYAEGKFAVFFIGVILSNLQICFVVLLYFFSFADRFVGNCSKCYAQTLVLKDVFMTNKISVSKNSAIIMVGQDFSSPIMTMMTRLQQAAAQDLALTLSKTAMSSIIISTPDPSWWAESVPVELVADNHLGSFHFGEHLSGLIMAHQLQTVWYFGSASAPLINETMLEEIQRLIDRPEPTLITNNIHSSDWIVFNQAMGILPILQKADRDNSLAWELRETLGYRTHILSTRYPELKLDLDTPTDFALIGQHPYCPSHLFQVIQNYPDLQKIPIQPVLDVLRREGSHILVTGRVAPSAWQTLSSATRCWIRVLAEERGMIANGRVKRGQVQSILGVLLAEQGSQKFVQTLAQMADAIIMDSRVLMAHQGELPSSSERFASDLGNLVAVESPWLRDLTQALHSAQIPILLGGHSLVAGGLDILSILVPLRESLAKQKQRAAFCE